MSDSENDPFVEKEKRDKKEGTEEIGAEDEGAEAEGDEAEGDEVEKEDEIFPHLGIEARNVSETSKTSSVVKAYLLKQLSSQEAAARQILGCPRVLRDADDSGPGHPHHGFQFELTNLWCVECIGACWHCQSTCCAIYEAKEEMKNNREALGKKKIKSSVCLVETIFTTLRNAKGRDPQTFVQCLECYKSFCPRCVSLCPSEICGSWRCIDCQPDKGGPCDWHKDM